MTGLVEALCVCMFVRPLGRGTACCFQEIPDGSPELQGILTLPRRHDVSKWDLEHPNIGFTGGFCLVPRLQSQRTRVPTRYRRNVTPQRLGDIPNSSGTLWNHLEPRTESPEHSSQRTLMGDAVASLASRHVQQKQPDVLRGVRAQSCPGKTALICTIPPFPPLFPPFPFPLLMVVGKHFSFLLIVV